MELCLPEYEQHSNHLASAALPVIALFLAVMAMPAEMGDAFHCCQRTLLAAAVSIDVLRCSCISPEHVCACGSGRVPEAGAHGRGRRTSAPEAAAGPEAVQGEVG